MKVLGRWSLASFMKIAVDLPYYLLLTIALPLIIVVGSWTMLTSDRLSSMSLEIPVHFRLDPTSHPFSTARNDINDLSITSARGILQIKGGVPIIVIRGGLLYAIISLGVILFVLNRLRAVFRTLKDQNPFVKQNASRIRTIGVVLVLGEVANAVLLTWLAAWITRDVSVKGLTFQTQLALNFWVIFAGATLIVLAEIFRLGAEMKGDLETARKIQFDLVPGEIYLKNNAIVQARMRPARAVGGDFYDVLDLDEKRFAVVMGDVTGKGLPAAMLMASVLGSLRALFSAGLRGGDLIAALNRHMCTDISNGRFVTLFYGELDTATGLLTYVNAGHNPPILLHADGRVDRLQPTAMILGVAADTAIEARQAKIDTTDRLLLFTDGLSEAFNKKDEEYGEERLADSFARVRALAPKAAIESLIKDVMNFSVSVQQHDDMTLMMIERQQAA
jgi:hypothetical protein